MHSQRLVTMCAIWFPNFHKTGTKRFFTKSKNRPTLVGTWWGPSRKLQLPKAFSVWDLPDQLHIWENKVLWIPSKVFKVPKGPPLSVFVTFVCQKNSITFQKMQPSSMLCGSSRHSCFPTSTSSEHTPRFTTPNLWPAVDCWEILTSSLCELDVL
jgi:hypothetical protein